MERDADLAQWYGWRWLCTGRAVLCYIAMQKHNEFSRVKTPRSCDPLLSPLCGGKNTCRLWHGHYAECVSICNGIVTDMADSMGGISEAMVSLPAEMQTAIENVGFLASIPLWLVTILGSLFITVLSFVMILTVYGRFFRLYMYTALAPLPLAAFAGESTQSVGISFLKSYVGVCLEGAVIVLACVIYSAFVGTPTVTGGEATTIVWSYLAETVFNMLVLVGLIKGSDRIIHEMMGL